VDEAAEKGGRAQDRAGEFIILINVGKVSACETRVELRNNLLSVLASSLDLPRVKAFSG
jgi:hypothetical protein